MDTVIVFRDGAKTAAPVAFCERCESGIKLATVARIAESLKPSEFVHVDATDAWGGALLGDPSASLDLKMRAVGHWLPDD